MLAELTWERQTESSLDLASSQGRLLGVARDVTGLPGDLLEQLIDERVDDAHGSLADIGLWRHLLKDPVDVHLEVRLGVSAGLCASGLDNLARFSTTFLGSICSRLAGILGGGSGGCFLWCHSEVSEFCRSFVYDYKDLIII